MVRIVFVALLAILILPLAAPAAAQHAAVWTPKTKAIGDWVYGCQGDEKEKWSCEALVVPPENAAKGDYALMQITRYGKSIGYLYFPEFGEDIVGHSLWVDGKRIVASLRYYNKYIADYDYDGAKALKASLPSILSGKTLTIKAPDGTLAGTVSLAGARAALSQLDKEQKMVGYTNAFVLKGKRRIVDYPPPMSMNPSRAADKPTYNPRTPDLTQLREFAVTVDCGTSATRGKQNSAVAIPPAKKISRALVFIDCGTEGMNRVSKAFIARLPDNDSPWSYEPMSYFDYTVKKNIPLSLLYNVEVSSAYGDSVNITSTRYLNSKDCGERATIYFNDYLTEEQHSPFSFLGTTEMPVCRGVPADNWIAVG